MKKRIALSIALLLVLLVAFVGCGAHYANDARIGTYTAYAPDGETVAYELTLQGNGQGEIVHYPVIGGEEREKIVFRFEGEDTLSIHGTEAVGGVLGTNEYVGTVVLEAGKYSVELRSISTSVPFALFVQN